MTVYLLTSVGYISCPKIAFQHICETLGFTSKPNQWTTYYPTPPQPDHMLEREYDQWLDDFAEELGLLNEPTEDQPSRPPHSDLDHQIHRPDDDFAEIDCEEYEEEQYDPDDLQGDNPEPEDCRFDTIAERDDFLYGD